jgi:hypothetical protein
LVTREPATAHGSTPLTIDFHTSFIQFSKSGLVSRSSITTKVAGMDEVLTR